MTIPTTSNPTTNPTTTVLPPTIKTDSSRTDLNNSHTYKKNDQNNNTIKEKIPGCGPLFSSLKTINTKITTLNSLITNLREDLKEILSKENLPRKQIFEKITNQKQLIEEKLLERTNLNEKQTDFITKIKELREIIFTEKKSNIKNINIKSELKDLESKIIKFKLNKKEEMEIVEKQTQLKKQLKNLKNLELKEMHLNVLNENLNEIKELNNLKNEEIVNLRTILDEFYVELKALSINGGQSNEIIKIENEIKKIDSQIKDLISQRNEIRENINLKQKEFLEKKEFYLKKQKIYDEIESLNVLLKTNIDEKAKLANELNGNNLNKARLLLSELKKIDFNGQVSMNLNLFQLFNEFGCDLRLKEKNITNLEQTVETMEGKIMEDKERLVGKIETLKKEIGLIESEIETKKKELKELRG
ncbi:hypothetical protein CDIK_2993 [Cucumispora dikerogammari]|nr:hypothetical protein CDIK_2993 [Cucumispora dikerogammari]